MAKFRLSLKYESGLAEEILEVEAESVSSAKKMCEDVVKENLLMIERLARFNVWTSRMLKSCSLCSYDYRMDFLGCEAVLKNQV